MDWQPPSVSRLVGKGATTREEVCHKGVWSLQKTAQLALGAFRLGNGDQPFTAMGVERRVHALNTGFAAAAWGLDLLGRGFRHFRERWLGNGQGRGRYRSQFFGLCGAAATNLDDRSLLNNTQAAVLFLRNGGGRGGLCDRRWCGSRFFLIVIVV